MLTLREEWKKINTSDLVFVSDMGKGYSCNAKRYIYHDDELGSNIDVVIKFFFSKVSDESIRREVEILKMLQGVQGVCQFVDCGIIKMTKKPITNTTNSDSSTSSDSSDRNSNQYMRCIITKYIPGRELFEVISELPKKKFPKCFRKMLKDIANILTQVHDMHIVHRDIKMENIIYDMETKNVTIIDWGEAHYIPPITHNIDDICDTNIKNTPHGLHYTTKVTGTPIYMAPEVITDKILSCENDVWSFGILYYYVLTHTTPYRFPTEESTYSHNAHRKFEIDYDEFRKGEDAVIAANILRPINIRMKMCDVANML